MSVLGGQFFHNNLHPGLNRNAEYLDGVIAVQMLYTWVIAEKENVSSCFSRGLRRCLDGSGSAYGIRQEVSIAVRYCSRYPQLLVLCPPRTTILR